MNMASMRDRIEQADAEFDAAIEAVAVGTLDEVATAIDRHIDAVLTAERSIAVARRNGSAAIAVIDDKREKATAAYRATIEQLVRDRARVAEDMQRRITAAEKLAAISRAALQAVQP